MGIYLNSSNAYGQFCEDVSAAYYVDKTDILNELAPVVFSKSEKMKMKAEGQFVPSLRYIAITRPRRFGKTVMANMIASYFGKGIDSHDEFDRLKVSQYPWYREHLNKHNVIHITFNKVLDHPTSYGQYIERIRKNLLTDLRHAYPDAEIESDDSALDAFRKVYEYCGQERFIFVLDE